jgi:DNA-binding SARP family transcriptional activator
MSRGSDALTLPSSRKVRALLGYLVLASRPVARSQICELLWDVPNDPRGELRWCLSKIRGLIDEKGHKRVIADGSTIRLDLADCRVDTLEVTRAPEHRIKKLGVERQKELAALFAGELLEGPRSRAARCSMPGLRRSAGASGASRPCCSENLARALPHAAAAPI